MRHLAFSTTVGEIYNVFSPETDLRSADFYRAVLDRVVNSGTLEVETDRVDVAVYLETEV